MKLDLNKKNLGNIYSFYCAAVCFEFYLRLQSISVDKCIFPKSKKNEIEINLFFKFNGQKEGFETIRKKL